MKHMMAIIDFEKFFSFDSFFIIPYMTILNKPFFFLPFALSIKGLQNLNIQDYNTCTFQSRACRTFKTTTHACKT